MATWAEVVDFSQPLTAKPSNAPEQMATPMRWAPVLHLDDKRERVMTSMRWAFSAVDKRSGRTYPKNMHCRDDKLLALSMWRTHFETRRGLLIVTSFNEGEEVPRYKRDRVTPTGKSDTVQWTMRPKDGSKLAIAVIYRFIPGPDGTKIPEFVMCTTKANKGIAAFTSPSEEGDKRMVAIMPESTHAKWLGEEPASLKEIQSLLQTYEDNGAWTYTRDPTAKPRQDDLF